MQGRSVLLAEDNLINQRVAKMMLCSLGMCCEVVSNGQEAVDAVQQRIGREDIHQFDVLLMDMAMPVMGGVDATKVCCCSSVIACDFLQHWPLMTIFQKRWQQTYSEHVLWACGVAIGALIVGFLAQTCSLVVIGVTGAKDLVPSHGLWHIKRLTHSLTSACCCCRRYDAPERLCRLWQ